MHIQRDNFRLIIHIRKVWLAVRFNCKLAFMLKNELAEKLAESDESFSLQRGECSVNQVLSLEVPAAALLTRYKKLRLIVMMISANGMVPAGFATFSLHPHSTYEQFELTLPLERCEDSTAQIRFMHLLEECQKTPRENSYKQSIFKKEGLLSNKYDLQDSSSKRLIVSPSRQRLSTHKPRNSEVSNFTPIQSNRQERYSRYDSSSRLAPRKSQANNMQKLNLDSYIRFEGNVQDNKAKQNEDSDFLQHHMTRDQLIKQHQQYWMEIIRMEEENEGLKQENERLKQQESHLKKEYKKLKEDYEANEEKIHAFVGQIQENSETILQLQNKVEEQKVIIQQKDEADKDYYKLIQMLQEQLNSQKASSEQANHQLSTQIVQLENRYNAQTLILQEEVKKLQRELQSSILREQSLKRQYLNLKEEKDTAVLSKFSLEIQQKQHQLQVAKETILFLQSQTKKYESLNSQLSEANSKLIQNMNVLQQASQDLNIKNGQLSTRYEQKRQQAELFQETVEQMDRRLTSEQAARSNIQQSLSYHKKHNKELQYIIEQHGEEVKHLKSKLYNREKELNIIKKENIQKNEQMSNYSRQIQYMKQEQEMLELKLVHNEEILASKNTKNQELAQLNQQLTISNKALAEKNAYLFKQLSNMQKEKNQLANILYNLEDNDNAYEQECKRLKEHKEQLKKHIAILENKVKSLQQQNGQTQTAFSQGISELKQSKRNDFIAEEAAIQSSSLTSSFITALSSLDQEISKHPNKDDQYQSINSHSIISFTHKVSKLEKQNTEFSLKIQELEKERSDLLAKLQEKQVQILQLKTFTHDKLQENLMLMKQAQQIKKKLAEIQENSIKMESSFRQEVSIDSNSKIEEPSALTVTGSEESIQNEFKSEVKIQKRP